MRFEAFIAFGLFVAGAILLGLLVFELLQPVARALRVLAS